MAKKVQLMTNAKEWQTVNGVEVLVDVTQEDLDPITDSNCVEIEGHRTLEETISQDNMFTPEIVETVDGSRLVKTQETTISLFCLTAHSTPFAILP